MMEALKRIFMANWYKLLYNFNRQGLINEDGNHNKKELASHRKISECIPYDTAEDTLFWYMNKLSQFKVYFLW